MSTARDQRVVIVGGGLAGIAAAVRLAEHGATVTVIETRKRLGGRATSFVDPTTGELLDNCQHVLMKCCTNLIDLYDRLGVTGKIRWHKQLFFAGSDAHIDTLEADDLPAPFHLSASLLRFKLLTVKEKLAIARGMLAVMRERDRDRCEGESFAAWLGRHNQPAGAIRKFWELVIISACNETLENVSAKYALQVFQEGFLCTASAYEMGLAAVPLVELYDPAEKLLEQSGGQLHLSSGADRFEFDGDAIRGLRLSSGEEVTGDVFISAVPFDRLAKLSTPEMIDADARLRSLDIIEVSPILGIHLMLRRADGRPVMDLPHLVLTDSPIQWVFNKGSGFGVQGSGVGNHAQHLHCVVSAAHELVDRSAEELNELAYREIAKVFPGARDAELVHARTVKEKRATFSVRPGMDRVRPGPTGAIANLFLAGDWVDTGWPATMEGAVRSGYAAAEVALKQFGVNHGSLFAPDLEPSFLYRTITR